MAERKSGRKMALHFNQVDVLMHPFFALENIRVSGRAMNVRGLTEKAALADYALLRVRDNWRRELENVKRNPRAIMILAGIHRGEKVRGEERKFFEGALTKEKLEAFSKEYQQFLHDAKKLLGKRLVYVTHGFGGKEIHLAKTLQRRLMLPARNVRVNAYGEYYDSCVRYGRDAIRQFIQAYQKIVFKKGKTSVTARQIRNKGARNVYRMVSLKAPDLLVAEALREFREKKRVTQKLIRKRSRYARAPRPKTFAKGLEKAFKKAGAKKIKRGKR